MKFITFLIFFFSCIYIFSLLIINLENFSKLILMILDKIIKTNKSLGKSLGKEFIITT